MSPSRTADRIIIRLPDGMRDQLKVAATANRRSVNAEVVVMLERQFEEMKTAGEREALPTV